MLATRVRGLAAAAHAGPSLVVTVVTVGLGVAAGLEGGRLVLLGMAIALGQVSIGWSNDWIDARAGRDGDREDKPLSSGVLAVQTVRGAAVGAAVATLVVSAALGPVPGALHVLAVASGWAYNARLKLTPASVLPYLVSFGLLPVIVAAMAGRAGPPWWAVVTAACFGAGVHLANALPDLEVDARTGVRGLPQRLGARPSVVATVVLLGVGGAAVLLGPGNAVGALTVVGLVVVVGLVSTLGTLGWRGQHEASFKVAMLTGLVVVALLVARGDALA
ncbi:hypothetical protein BH23ACT9_BH23ACT9_16200 [soil metagenome]